MTPSADSGHPALRRFFRALNRRPVAVGMLTLALLGAATIAAWRIPIELIPKGFAASTISVTAPWQGANPTEIENKIIRPLEEELRTIRGVKDIISVATPGTAIVSLTFPGDFDMDQAQAEVSDRIERVRPKLPREVDRVQAQRRQADQMPILFLGVLYPPEDWDNAQDVIGESLKNRIEAVDGVASVFVRGISPSSIRILLDEERVVANRVDIGELLRALQGDNLSQPAGDLEEGGDRHIIRVDSRFKSIQEIEEFPVRDGLTIQDIGRVAKVRSAPEYLFRINGRYAISVGVSKETSANTFEVCKSVTDLVTKDLPNDVALGSYDYSIFWNQGENIQATLESLVKDAALGGLIAVGVLWMFLRRLRYTLLIAVSIPFSVLLTLAWLYFTGDSFNMLSMMGITISIGMLVDNSVVIVESIFSRRERGASLDDACTNGPSEVMLAVVTATLTTVVVFLPLIFMSEDRNARIMSSAIGIPLCISLLAALLLAIIIVPVASKHMHGDDAGSSPPREGKVLAAIHRFFPALVAWSLTRRFRALTLAALFLASSGLADSGSGFAGQISMGSQLTVRFDVSPNRTLGEVEKDVIAMEAALTSDIREEMQIPDIGIDFNRKRGNLYLWPEVMPGPEEKEALFARLEELLPKRAAVNYHFGESFNKQNTEGGDKWTRLQLKGPDSQVVNELAKLIRERAVASADFKDVAEPENLAREIHVSFDRTQMARIGLDSQALLGNIEWGLRGFMVSRFQTSRNDIPLILEYDEDSNPSKKDLTDMSIWTGKASLPLSSLAKFEHARGPGMISRRNGKTVALIGLKTTNDDMKKSYGAAKKLMDSVDLPEGYHWEQLGGWEDFNQDMDELKTAFALAIALVFLLMGLLFDSIALPFSILPTIAFAVVGAKWAFKIFGVPMDILGAVGMIVLAGIVVNNGIVLVDRILRLEHRGQPRNLAVVQAVKDRLRPVIMTALTTVCGLLPIALSEPSGEGFNFQGLAVGVAGGLAFTTFFTLWTVPLLYTILQDLGDFMSRSTSSKALRKA